VILDDELIKYHRYIDSNIDELIHHRDIVTLYLTLDGNVYYRGFLMWIGLHRKLAYLSLLSADFN